MLLVVVVVANVSAQMFGVFEYSDYGRVFGRIVSESVSGPELTEREILFQETGAYVVYYFEMFILVMVLTQVVITILMDSWCAAEALRAEQRKAIELRGGFVSVKHKLALTARVYDILVWAVSSYSPELSAWSPLLIRQLDLVVKAAEADEQDADNRALLVTREALMQHISKRTAARLELIFGVEQAENDAQLTSTMHESDVDMNTLRAAVSACAEKAGDPIPATEIQRLSKSALLRLRASFDKSSM